MQKSLADALVKSPAPGDNAAKTIAAMMKRPARNHSDKFTPMVERFVFANDDAQFVYNSVRNMSAEVRDKVLGQFRLPLPIMWLEYGNWGFFVADEQVAILCRMGKKVHALAFASLASIRAGGEWQDYTRLYARTDDYWWADNCDHVANHFGLFGAMCAAINSPRAATREKLLRYNPAISSTAQGRRVQRGYPIFSFNQVKLKRPDTSLLSSGVLITGAPTSKRGHWVIGHWRLIDGAPEPYWTWVDAHERGDDALGFVAHERHIKLDDTSGDLRRGFLIPETPGMKGDKLAAVKVM